LIERYPGSAPLRLRFRFPEESEVLISLPAQYRVQPSQEMLEAAEGAFGRRVAVFN